MLAILARQVTRIRANSLSPTRHLNRAWFSPLSMRCLRLCTPPVRLFSVYSIRVQPQIRQFPPTRWGNGYKGTAATQFPHPDIYSLHDSRIPLDQLTVRHITRILSARKRKHPPAKAAWQARLNIKDHVWEDAASRCTTTFLTPRDVHTHFKHIIHRALTTRERGLTPQYGTLSAASVGSERRTPYTWGNAT
eukprot:scaffold8125_cov113-Isochrysis_galbana.AAC.1